MFFQELLTGFVWGDWADYRGSPLRALVSPRGEQPPVGFWDPAWFTKKTAVVIDLGTTYSGVGFWMDDGVENMANDQGNRATPADAAASIDPGTTYSGVGVWEKRRC